MSSKSPDATAAALRLVDEWLHTQLHEDATLRRQLEADNEGAWYAGVIIEPEPDGRRDRVVQILDDDELKVLLNADEAEQRARLSPPRRLLTDVNEVHLKRAFRDQTYDRAVHWHRIGHTAQARRHLDELLKTVGLELDPEGDAYDQAVRSMVRAQKDYANAATRRGVMGWRPGLDDDPASDLVERVRKPISAPLPAGQVPLAPAVVVTQPISNSSPARRANQSFRTAADEAIPAIARSENLSIKRKADYEHAVTTFLDWLERDPPFGQVTSEVAGDFRVALAGYPTNPNKRAAYRDLKTFAARAEKARASKDQALLGGVTINGKYLTPLRKICDWHRSAGSGLPNPFDEISVPKPRKTDPRTKRRDSTNTELQRLFALPVFTGSKAIAGPGINSRGTLRIRNWRYWVPLICVFSGMRLNEACGLALADIKVEDGIHFFHVRDMTEGQSLKAEASRRKVPIHEQLIFLGLLTQIEEWRRAGQERLFDDIKLDSSGYFSSKPSDYFNGLISKIADDDPDDPGRLVFHSTRHTVTTRLRAANVRKDVAEAIVGHEGGDTHSGYGRSDIQTLKEAVNKITYPNLDLSETRLPDIAI